MRHARLRQAIVRENDPRRGVAISTLAREYARGSTVETHAHGSDQLIYASLGVMQVSSGQQFWVIPPHFGLWIPARTRHEIRMPEAVSMRTLYLRPGLAAGRCACAVLHVRPLLRELIFEAVRVGNLRTSSAIERALAELLLAELGKASPVPGALTLPSDGRALGVAQAVMADLRSRATLKGMCAGAGISVRTLERAFRKETGTDFETWRRHVRLLKAVELLVSGRSVKEAAFTVGYQQPNALVALFRSTFGATPKAWMLSLGKRG